jgi:HK97 family phage major capsid protein
MDFAELNELRSVEELSNKQKGVKGELQALNDEYQGLPFPDAAREKYADLVETNEEIDRRVTELDKRDKYIEALSRDPGQTRPAIPEFRREERVTIKERDIYDTSTIRMNLDDPAKGRQEYRDRAMRAVEIAHFPAGRGVTKEAAQDHIAYLLDEVDSPDAELARRILKTGSPQYRAAFRKFMASGTTASMTNEEQRAFSLGTTGIPITFTLDPTLIPVSASVVNPLRAISNVESIVGSNEWRGATAAAITASRASEAAVTTDNTPTLAQPAIVCSRVQAFVPFSVEAQGDWPGMDSGLARLFGDSKDDEEATAFATGNGTPPNPFGVLTGATGTTALATGLTVTAANLYSIEGALAPRFRPRAQWVANRAVYNIIRALDTAGGAQLWLRVGELIPNNPASDGGAGNTGLRLLGYPVNELSTMPATIVNGVKDILLGDFSMFKIIDRVGMNVELIQNLTQQAVAGAGFGFPTGQRGLFAWWRNGSKVLDAVGFRAGTGTT